MNFARKAALGLLVLPALLALRPVADALGFHPDEGSSLTKSFEWSMEFSLDDATMMVDGNDMGGMMLGQFPTVELNSTTVVEDTYEKMGEGRPLDLVRLFQEVSMDYDAGDESGTESMDELEGTSVRFTWDEEDGDYRVTPAEEGEGPDEEILNGLGEDMDLRGLLPDGEVAEGDTWEVEGDRIWSVLLPGMDLSAAMANADIPPEAAPMMEFLEEQLGGLVENFTFSCEYQGSRDEDGTAVGVVAVLAEVTHSIDLIPMVEAMMAAQELPVEINIEYADVELELSGAGELLWNLEGGFVYGFVMDADMALYIDSAASMDGGGQVQEMESSLEFSGAMSWGAESE